MLDMKLIRTEPQRVKEALRRREMDCDAIIDELLQTDAQRREISSRADAMKAEQNAASKEIPSIKKAGGDTAPIMAKMKELSEKVKQCDAELTVVEQRQKELMLSLPNMPDDDVVAGGKENNEPLRYYGNKPTFDFEVQNHVDLCESHGMIDYVRGAKLAGMVLGFIAAGVRGWNGRCSIILFRSI